MAPDSDRYRAFLLRVWTKEPEGALLSSVRDVETGETYIFANLDQLNEWLRVVMNGPATPSVTPSPEVG